MATMPVKPPPHAVANRWNPPLRATDSFNTPSTTPEDNTRTTGIHLGLSDPQSLYRKALRDYQKPDLQRAETALAAVVQLQWEFPAAHLLLGNIAAAMKDYRLALERYAAVIEIDPYEPTPHFNSALTYLDLQEIDKARSSLEQALSVSQGYAPAYFELARLLCTLNQSRDAIALLIKSAYKEPQNPDALLRAGELYYERTFCASAIKCYQRALKIDPWNQNAYVHLGIAQFRNGECAAATLSFAHCLNRNPKHKLARAFQKLSNTCLIKFTHPELQTKKRSKRSGQTAFPFAAAQPSPDVAAPHVISLF